jgi:hypothetical protein
MEIQLLEQPSEPQVQSLTIQLSSPNKEYRNLAEAELFAHPEEHIIELLEVLKRENKRKPRRFWTAFIGVMVLQIVLNVLLTALWHDIPSLTGAFAGLAVAIGAGFAPTKLQRETAQALAELDDLRAIGPLTGALDRQDKATIGDARKALIRLLPRLKEKDFDLLDAQQRTTLNKYVMSSSSDLSAAVVTALRHVGDSRAISNLQKLAHGKGPSKKNVELRDKAQQCILAIQARIPAEKARETLLRAANAPGDPEDTLLRPAGSSAGDDASTLLRPHSLES